MTIRNILEMMFLDAYLAGMKWTENDKEEKKIELVEYYVHQVIKKVVGDK